MFVCPGCIRSISSHFHNANASDFILRTGSIELSRRPHRTQRSRLGAVTQRARGFSGLRSLNCSSEPSGTPTPSDDTGGNPGGASQSPKYRVEELLAWLNSPDPTTRLRAVIACRQLSADEAAPVLERAIRMNDPEIQNRSFAAIALGYLPNKRSYELLSGLLRNDTAGEVRSSAAAALGYLGERRALPELRLALLEDIHWSTRVSAAVSLGLLQDERAFDVLVDGLRLSRRYKGEEGNALKRACLGSLGELGMPQAVSHLVFYAQEHDFLTRQVLAEALGRLLHRARRLDNDRTTQRQLTLARECLEYLARDDHANVRRAAQMALANLSLVVE
ncbi:hypothetical protein CCYA_CCYA06G1825 [Cyanidiococcus yangmingshanensis]|nr:hypothetical protein CCYA_CCYA06G1825 [Cyanidiococcus yangmingshanensis]